MNHRPSRKTIVGSLLILLLTVAIPLQGLLTDPQGITATITTASPMRTSQDINWTVNGTHGNNGWYRSPLALTCTWNHDIIQAVYYRLPGMNWTQYTGLINLSQQGNITFEWKGVDWNGSDIDPGAKTLNIDYTPPYLRIDIVKHHRRVVGIYFTTKDNISLLDRVDYYVGSYLQYTVTVPDSSGWYSGPVWILKPLPHINVNCSVTVFDKAGNNASGGGKLSHSQNYHNILSLLRDFFERRQTGE